ncbi:ABC transporter ATP-binding protein [Bosea sp. (in: a-proteobacteria)]|uniref:ABC transporter ATP-binding protein n=1 Tax=Bosea sp. (in: a-proteobacteria) TaxID=1871050 RepID=UPI00261DF0D1|nr:ABC transporter ATP-binding protein [Bosea sp. (in: a-proteobacteria)]MCO5090884.1 ABC transporter ATP-binding protein [Bosea sp. (in: a-proteobacteria)]
MLSVRGLHAWYGKSHILQGVELDVAAGEIVTLLGRNGVGRSTTVKAIMGDVERRGEIRFQGERIDTLQAHQIAHRGIGCVPEDRQVFPTLTVRQNLLLGFRTKARPGRWTIADAFSLFPRLEERADTLAGALSGGEQQLLSMTRTLMGDPDLVLIDEPTEGLAPMMVDQVRGLILEIARRGSSILLVEQKLTIALKVADRALVMGHGRIVFDGKPSEIETNDQVRREFLEV